MLLRLMLLVQVAVGLVLLWSASEHLKNMQFFLISVFRYELFPQPMVKLIVLMMPYVELLLGVYLLANLNPSFSRLMTALVFFAFAILQITALARGLEIDCGCFGTSNDKPISSTAAMLNLAVAITFFVYWRFTPKPVVQVSESGQYT